MSPFSKILIALIGCMGCITITFGQLTVTGTVYDSTKTIPVKDVTIKSSNGTVAVTDSTGRYTIVTSDKDSLTFIYQDKPTAKFAVKQIPYIGAFDISLHVRVAEKFRTLKEVKVYAKNYRQDSIANREEYARYFNYKKPGISLSTDANTGAAGADLNEFINVFRFKRNRQLRKLQERLVEQEQEHYIDYRFNKTTVRRITKLEGEELDEFMQVYRPDFAFTQQSSVVEFYQYILNAAYDYKAYKEKQQYIDSRFSKETVQMITGFEGKYLEAFMTRYRPGYEFTANSDAAGFYNYVLSSSEKFKQETSTPVNSADSTRHH